MTLPWKRSWEKKLDELLVRAKRVTVNMNGLPESPLPKQVREKHSVVLKDVLKDPGVVAAGERLIPVMKEHDLQTKALGCFVTLTTQREEKSTRFMLGVSWDDGRPHGTQSWTDYPKVFDKIRRHLGAPESCVAKGPVAVHWVWWPDEPAQAAKP